VIARSGQEPCRLSLFQQIMAQWEEVEPYNAAHVVRLRGRINAASLREAIQTACQVAGVGAFVLDREKNCYRYAPTDGIELREIEASHSAEEILHRTITEEMNTPFPETPGHPLRWMVLDDPRSDSHFLAAVWRHLPADDVAIRLLIRRVLNRYCGTPFAGDQSPLRVLAPDYARVMRHHFRRLGYLRTLQRETQRYFRLRHVHRMRELPGESHGSHFCVIQAPQGLIGRLARACLARRVTVNDAFLAALGAAIAAITPDRNHHPRRRGLALGTAVNVRPEASVDLSNCFGLYLGHWVTILEEPDLGDFEQLLARIAEQTQREKTEKRAVGPHWNFWAVARLRRWGGLKDTRAWYRKVYPISAVLSNVKLNAAWFRGAGERVLDYIRISPTGPALPLVLATARLGDRLNLTLGYHTSVLTDPEARNLTALFLARLELVAGGGLGASVGRAQGR